jgi:hypothetical protein
VSEEVGCRAAGDLLVQFDEGELGCAVDRHEEVELALLSSDFGDVDMEIADRIGFELTFGGGFAFDLRKLRDAMALQATVQR